jgi:hypothetical protein
VRLVALLSTARVRRIQRREGLGRSMWARAHSALVTSHATSCACQLPFKLQLGAHSLMHIFTVIAIFMMQSVQSPYTHSAPGPSPFCFRVTLSHRLPNMPALTLTPSEIPAIMRDLEHENTYEIAYNEFDASFEGHPSRSNHSVARTLRVTQTSV